MNQFDVIVIGAGHAGIESAYIAAKMNAKTLLITIDSHKIALMPCNPSLGGLGKGHIVYEVSALGGLMPKLASKTYLQARMLNTRKGPAVQGLRLQIDKYAYTSLAREELLKQKNLTIEEATAESLLIEYKNNSKKITGVRCADGRKFYGKTIIITTGTFLNGILHIGAKQTHGGRQDEDASLGLTQSLEQILGTKLGRLKTGTPPRLLRSSLNFSIMEQQDAHQLDYLFEFKQIKTIEKHPCFITSTNEITHKIISENINRSALFSGNITGIGPRYCPSIEDKVGRFPDRMSHHVFVEPEGGDNTEIYPNGISTSLPEDVQYNYVRSIKGFENAIITKPGYAVEYDFLQPNNLTHTLETKTVQGLFFAGQINGTTGYEEAAGQGIVAGINAALKVQGKKPFVLDRTESYIGVMIDDIITLGVNEPYRMFTSRAERRLILRQDNVFFRLMPYAKQLGTVDNATYKEFLKEKEIVETYVQKIKETRPHGEPFKAFHDCNFFKDQAKLKSIYKLSPRALLSIHAEIRYDGYIEKEKKETEKAKRFANLLIPETIDYTSLPGLTKELQEKLIQHRPQSIAQAQLIPGMTPAAISLLIFRVKNTLKQI